MSSPTASLRNDVPQQGRAANAGVGLAVIRFTLGAMFVSVFFENLAKDFADQSDIPG